MLVTEPHNKERRSRDAPQADFGSYTPGIRRIVEAAIADLRLHDEHFAGHDESEWQTQYSLLNHHERVRIVMADLGRAHGRCERDILIGEIAAQLHDTGKMDDECRMYRINRKLSPDEKPAVDTHPDRSGEYVRKLKSRVRPEDYPLIEDAYPIICSHHKPYLIQNPRLRAIGVDLHLADIFVSVQEFRFRPGLSVNLAVDALQEMVEIKLKDPLYEECSDMLLAGIWRIVQLYAVDLKKLTEEFRPSGS